jgi:hypothetical protein
MDEEREGIERRLEESRQCALDVEEGAKSRYWRLLERKIVGWLRGEEKHLELLNVRLIREAADVEERNDVVKRIALLKQFLEINQTLINESLHVMTALKTPLPDNFRRAGNFVGQK